MAEARKWPGSSDRKWQAGQSARELARLGKHEGVLKLLPAEDWEKAKLLEAMEF
mgnify:CR=1 FL=1